MTRRLGRWPTQAVRAVVVPLILARDFLLTIVVLLLAFPLWALPWRAASKVGRGYGYLLGVLSPKGRRVAGINLFRAYGADITRARASQIAWRNFAGFVEGITDGIQFGRRYSSGAGDLGALYRSEDPELEQRILADPRPKVFVTGHLGSWEVAAGIADLRWPGGGAGIFRHIANPFLDALVRRLRTRRPGQLIDKRGAAMVALARLREGRSVAILLDENAGPRGVFVNFFGRPASTGRLAALLSLNTGTPLVVGACVRQPGRRFLYRLALIEPSPNPTPEAVTAATQAIVSTLERWIRDEPDQWRWTHARWRNRPDGTEESYEAREFAREVLV